jgi:hypothetical protein
VRLKGSLERRFPPIDLADHQTLGIVLPSENFRPSGPLLIMSPNIEIELLRQNDMLRGAVIFAMDKIRQMRAGHKIDTTAVLETLGKQLSEARATNQELFAGMVAPELVGSGPPECS